MGLLERHLDQTVIGQMNAAIASGKLKRQDHSHSIGKPIAKGAPLDKPYFVNKWPDSIHSTFLKLLRSRTHSQSRSELRQLARQNHRRV